MPSRHRSRERALQMIYQWEVSKASPDQVVETYWNELSKETAGGSTDDAFANNVFRGVVEHIAKIDGRIQSHADNWRLERMSAVDRCILRLGVYELMEDTSPAPVIINEALEIGGRFSGKESVPFLNGVLDAVRKSLEDEQLAAVCTTRS